MASSIGERLGEMRGFSSGTDRSDGARMKRLVGMIVALVVALILLPTTFTYVNPGYVGIEISRIGNGVSRDPLQPGIKIRNPLTTDIVEYPIFMQTMTLTKDGDAGASHGQINVNSAEGQPISLDVSMSFELDAAKVPQLYTRFRKDIEQIQSVYVTSTIRMALQEVMGSEQITDILGPKKAEVVQKAQELLTKRLSPDGIMVRQFTINELRPPQSVIAAINEKNVMQQQALTAQNQLQKQEFEARGAAIQAEGRAKAILAEAEAQAKANRLLSESITPTLVQYEMTKKWNGQMPQVTGGAMPMISLPKP
jgi:regulator of protease activity HflC (stomatin/prohibitin superfamily)